MADSLTLDVNGHDVTYSDPGKARAAARRWRRMASELDTAGAPADAAEKMRELRARAKAAEDWARATEDRQLHDETISRHSPTSSNEPEPAGGPSPTPRARRRAAATLTATGVRKAARGASTARRGVRRASRSYEAAGGAPIATSAGELAIFFFGGIILLTLLGDVLSAAGSARFQTATNGVAQLAHRLIAPVPIVSNGASAPTKTASTVKGG